MKDGKKVQNVKLIATFYDEISLVEEEVNVVVLIVGIGDNERKFVGHFLHKFEVHNLMFIRQSQTIKCLN